LLLDQHLRAAGCQVTEVEVDALIEKLREDARKSGPRFKLMLGDEAELRKTVTAELRWAKYAEEKATDAELRKLFKENRDLFDGSRVQARHILIAPASQDPRDVKKAADRLRAIRRTIETEVRDGLAALPASTGVADFEKEQVRLLTESFARHAREKSDCPSKSQGGELGSFPRAMVVEAAVADAAFALKPLQMSDVVQTKHGQHLILVTERKPGRDVSFADVNKDVVRMAYWERLKARLLAELQTKANGERKSGE
jgi:peptidyl-prolyl cis-trans isomerase C